MIDYLNKETYNFNLPEELIATHPTDKRDHCKLMIMNRDDGQIEHKNFFDIVSYFKKGDVLVFNDSKVIPARVFFKKETGGIVEVLFLKRIDDYTWECLLKGRKLKVNDKLFLDDIYATIIEDNITSKKLKFSKQLTNELLNIIGNIPLPPYIIQSRKKNNEDEIIEDDKIVYQNVFAKREGSIASPTSGLHFTNELIEKIKSIGVEVLYITLHVGFATFNPIKENDLRKHIMHFEEFYIDQSVVNIIINAKKDNRRIIACGTTVSRVLESEYDNFSFKRLSGETNIFIYPPYKFKCVDAMITNFHTPHSTLLAMVSAFSDYNHIMNAYNIAIENKYRFFSYGDAMFML